MQKISWFLDQEMGKRWTHPDLNDLVVSSCSNLKAAATWVSMIPIKAAFRAKISPISSYRDLMIKVPKIPICQTKASLSVDNT